LSNKTDACPCVVIAETAKPSMDATMILFMCEFLPVGSVGAKIYRGKDKQPAWEQSTNSEVACHQQKNL
jgi:hypothetical protein